VADIVTRLRNHRCAKCGSFWLIDDEAADDIDRLRAAGDALAAAVDKLDGFITGNKAVASEVEQTLRAWEEARRG